MVTRAGRKRYLRELMPMIQGNRSIKFKEGDSINVSEWVFRQMKKMKQ